MIDREKSNMEEDKLQVANKLRAWLRESARNWPAKGDTNLVHVKCTAIERAIPPESQHEDAKKALEYCKQARLFGTTEKGFLFLMWAESARKDFELFDDYIKSRKHSNAQSKKARLPRSIIREIKENLASQYPDCTAKELWPRLFAELEEIGLAPEENVDVQGTEWYVYDRNDSRKIIKFTTFANIKINK